MKPPTVVVLLSDKRSGSTMFQEEICKHEDVQTVRYSPHTYLETQHWLKGACLLGMPKQTFYGHRYPSSLQRAGAARAYLVDELSGNLPDWRMPDTDREIVFDGWEALCNKFAKPVFFEKSPQHVAQWGSLSLMLDWIRTTSYSVRVIGLVRNPLSVMYSADDLFHTDPDTRQHGWADMHRNLLAFQAMLPAEQFKLVRYEDLITNPVVGFSEVCQFIGVPSDARIGSSVHVSSRNKWLDDQRYDIHLHPSVIQVAKHFGYTDTELNNPQKQGIPISEKTLGRIRHLGLRIRSRLLHGLLKPMILGLGKKRVRK